jgi:L-seryl-tRNA(Ser) seleniumtransferase
VKSELFRLLPSIDELMRRAEMQTLIDREGRTATLEASRAALEQLRSGLSTGALDEEETRAAVDALPSEIDRRLRSSMAYSLRPVINATGVILHTNLGRSPLSAAALAHAAEVSQSYSNLEFDLATGERGKRDVHVDRLFTRLFSSLGREVSTIVVNNNAAAVLLALNALAEGGEVLVSRGELVEIGGSFRIPDVMSKSGATLREIGTTNRTRVADYEKAITERTRLMLRVHRSNFEIVGFTEQPSLEELVSLGRKHSLPVMEDLGSGALFDLRSVGIKGEPMVGDSLRAGVDVVTYSGDKLLGGPQAGMISGNPEIVAQIRKNPMFRALRVDKMIYATLEATLLAYAREDYDALPALRMMRLTDEQLMHRARQLAERLREESPGLQVEVIESQSVLGGGSAPGSTLSTRAVAVQSDHVSASAILQRLREWETPIVARVEEGRVLLDLRTIEPAQETIIVAAMKHISQ